jgi:hypothetical protein
MTARSRRAGKPRASNGHGGVYLHPSNPKPENNRVDILIGTPTLGSVRIEWFNAMAGMVTPPNWATVRSTPLGYTTASAQNILVDTVLRGKFRALLLIEDDTIPPLETLIVMDRWFWKMERKKAPPVVSGLYHIKGSAEVRKGKKGGIELLGPEPLAYRGSGARAYRDWTPGDVIWVSGVPTGALLVHRSILEAWAREPDVQTYTLPGYPFPLKEIFQNPSHVWMEEDGKHVASGTSDLWWSQQTIDRGLLKKAGWPQFQVKPYPYIIDTALGFKHIDRCTGVQF